MTDVTQSIVAAQVAARRFFRAIAQGDDPQVLAILHPALVAAAAAVGPGIAHDVARRSLHLEPTECGIIADQFEARFIRAALPVDAATKPDAGGQLTMWVYAPDGRRVALTLFLEAGEWRVVPDAKVPFSGEEAGPSAETVAIPSLPPEA